jgi:hypothetical protein
MATNNRGVMVYLPPEIEQYITEYCNDHNITRKDKQGRVFPSLGTGIVTYLKSQILGISPDEIRSKSPSLIGLSKDEVLALIEESVTTNISSAVADALAPIAAEVREVREFSQQLEGEIATLKQVIRDRVDLNSDIGTNFHP